ncbi:MAG: hypothetical protein KGL39_43735 [Patescibacteria group bacterium]|nr:hypothetical protein [Patescibacteria group bacterium]
MAVANFLENLGQGLEKGAKVAGAIALPLAERTAQVVSGEAPEIDAEKRAHAMQLEDAALDIKAKELENQIALGEKYGTLNPAQRQQYINQLTQLYSHPRHAGQLMQKLQRIVHPNGAVAQRFTPLKDATPEGGTAYQDEQNAQRELEQKNEMAKDLAEHKAEIQSKYRVPAGKSPGITGDKLPANAVGPDGMPISANMRNPTQSFVEYGGQWWPTQKKPPVGKKINGHFVLLDSATMLPMPGGDLGPIEGVRVTDTGSWQPNGLQGAEAAMVWVPRHTVTGPGGTQIEVQIPSDIEDGAAKPQPQQKASVGGILKSSVKPVSAVPGGAPRGALKTLPGSNMMAINKNPLYRADVTTYEKAKNDYVAATKLASFADQVASKPGDAINQKRLAVNLERLSAGRFTTQALDYIIKAGWGNTIEQWANNPSTGALPADVMRQLIDGAHENLNSAKDALSAASSSMGATPPQETQAPQGNVENWVRDPKTGKLVKQ